MPRRRFGYVRRLQGQTRVQPRLPQRGTVEPPTCHDRQPYGRATPADSLGLSDPAGRANP
jgi:hypothetical protein